MTRSRVTIGACLAGACLAAAAMACGDGYDGPAAADPPAAAAVVTLVYVAATSVDPAVSQQFSTCVQGVGQTHIHPSWSGFARIDMTAAGDRWTVAFADVPVGGHSIRVNDPNVCAENPTGAVTRNVFANGVRLTTIVDTPGSGTEPGLAFTVAEDGTVSP